MFLFILNCFAYLLKLEAVFGYEFAFKVCADCPFSIGVGTEILSSDSSLEWTLANHFYPRIGHVI